MPKLNAGQPVVFPDGTMQPLFRDFLLGLDGELSVSWSQVTGTPTTAAGYGITDVYTKSEVNALTRKNLIINGAFIINQRSGTRTPGVGNYGLDRWKGHASGLEQVVEYVGPASSVTLSWEGGGTGSVNGTSGASPVTGSVSAATNFSVIVPDDAENVQCELGDVATAFVDYDMADELARCQRYYFQNDAFIQLAPINKNNTLHRTWYAFPVPMRVTPTVSYTLSVGIKNTGIMDNLGITLGAGSIPDGTGVVADGITADAEL